MKNFLQWFLNQSMTNFDYKLFLAQQNKNDDSMKLMDISQVVLEEVDIYIQRICAQRKVRVLPKDKYLFRRDTVVLYVVLLNKNYFNKKSTNYFSGKLLEEMRVYLSSKMDCSFLKPTSGTDDITAVFLNIMHHYMTDRSRKPVSLSKTVIRNPIADLQEVPKELRSSLKKWIEELKRENEINLIIDVAI